MTSAGMAGLVNIVLVGFVMISTTKSALGSKSERELISDLLKDYNKFARPRERASEAVEVEVSYFLIFIEQLNEKRQFLESQGWLALEWHDDYLRWDDEEYSNITSVTIPGEQLWKPDLVVRNSVDNVYGPLMDENNNYRAEIHHDGTVEITTAGQLRTACQVDVTYFPFDHQVCYIHIDSWSYTGEKVKLINSQETAIHHPYRESGQWELIHSSTNLSTLVFEEGHVNYHVKFIFHLDRKPAYYVANIIVPCVIMATLQLLVFLLPADSGEKVSLCITLMLSFSVFLLLVADNMPKTSTTIPIIGLYILTTMSFSALSLLSTTLVLRMHHHAPDQQIPPRVRSVVFGCLSKISFVHLPARTTNAQRGHTKLLNNLMPTPPMKAESSDKPAEPSASVLDTLREIDHTLAAFKSKADEDQHTATIKQDWIDLARVLDGFFLRLFVIISVIMSTVLLGIYPGRQIVSEDPVIVS